MKPRIALLSVFALVAACHKPQAEAPQKQSAPPPQPVKVQTAAIEKHRVPQYLTLTGSVLADRQSEMAANVSGRIISTHVERGQAVKAGQIIAVVDSQASSLSAAAAEAQAKVAETQKSLAQTECERADTLFKQGATTQAEYDRLKTQCSAQLFSAEAARANAGLAAKIAGDAIIRAPFEGVVGERYVNVGEYVQPPTRVASLYTVNPVRVSISVPENSVGLVRQGQEVEARVGAYGDRLFPGKVRFIAPALRPQTRDLVIEAVVENPDGALKPGMFATVKLVVGEKEWPTVPATAIRGEGTVKRLFLAREQKAVEMVVRTGVAREGRVAVLEELSPSETVIVQPPAGLRDGAPIVQ